MKLRTGYRIIWSDGTTYYSDCPKGIEAALRAGWKVSRARILSARLRPCASCFIGFH